VGIIVTEEYVCDYCTKPITHSDVIVGKLSLRKRGARGLGTGGGTHVAFRMLGQAHRHGQRCRPHPALTERRPG